MPTQTSDHLTPANALQWGGDHYKVGGEEHWDRVYRLFGPGYFIGNVTKYTERYQKKNGLEDLRKAAHYLQKLAELEYADVAGYLIVPPLKHYSDNEIIEEVNRRKGKTILDMFSAKELMDELRRRASEEERLAMEEHLGGAPPGTICKECGGEDGTHALECVAGGYRDPNEAAYDATHGGMRRDPPPFGSVPELGSLEDCRRGGPFTGKEYKRGGPETLDPAHR